MNRIRRQHQRRIKPLSQNSSQAEFVGDNVSLAQLIRCTAVAPILPSFSSQGFLSPECLDACPFNEHPSQVVKEFRLKSNPFQ